MPQPPTPPTSRPTSRPWWKRALVRTARSLFGQRTIRHHYDLFEWHCAHLFPFRQHLTSLEWAYLETCFQHGILYPELPHDSGYGEYSSFTYSHRIKGEQVNSSRLAYGSLGFPDVALAAALPVLQERKIEVAPYFLESPDSLFYGLGWDFLAGQCKVYFRILDLAQLPFASLHSLIDTTLPSAERRQEGLVSFTFVDSSLHEEKVYIYPQAEAPAYHDLFKGTKGRVLMATSQRGTLTQYDVSAPTVWRERMNEAGRKIVDTYAAHGYPLDTIAMRDQENFTLYFPGAFLPFGTRKHTP